MNNKIIKIQEMLFDEMEKLSDDNLIREGLGKREVSRSQALTQSAGAYIKAINIQLKVKELASKNPKYEETLLKELGVLNEEKN